MFIWMQKISFISNFFFEILERNCKLAILGILGMLFHPHQKSLHQFEANFHAYMHAKNQLHHSLFYLHMSKK